MTMLLAIGKFFSELFQLFLGACSALMKWVREHPKAAAVIVFTVILMILTNAWTYQWAQERAFAQDAKVIASLRNEVEKANEEARARDEKIKRIETQSKAAADETDRALTEAKQASKQIVTEYEKKLAAERKNYRVVYVKDKDGKDTPVNIDQQGAVICDKFSQTFSDTVNKLIDNANKPLNLKTSTEVKQ